MSAERSEFQLAEVNVAKLRAPLDDPLLAGFVAQLDAVNAEAEASDGFIWRLASDGGGASSYIRAFDDDSLLINISVWQSVDHLHRYVYRSSGHAVAYRARREWFEPLATPLAMWWIPAGHEPTILEAKERLELLQREGPTADAFTFKSRFPAPDSAARR